MNIYLVIILVILIGRYLLDLVVEKLNMASADPMLPAEFAGFYDAQKYRQAQEYLKENTKFTILKDSIFTAITIVFILVGGFNLVDQLARNLGWGAIATGLVFAAILIWAIQLLNIPFSVYHTFVIEEKYGFNRTSVKTFVLDLLKSWALGVLIGGIVIAAILWFFARTGKLAWVYCWLAVSLFQLFLLFIAPAIILPLFNKFTPLAEGELKTAIQDYAAGQNFKLKGIFTMDGSRRSSKGNAFFTGFGKLRRIALFDTLIAKQSVPGLVSVLAHEIGHYKKKHVLKRITISIISSGIMFFILSLFINNPGLFSAFKMEQLSIYASLFFFGFLYTPINLVFAVFIHSLARRQEYQADAFAVATYQRPEEFITALKKLSVDNLANLTPHPLKVFLDYTHPPVLRRIQAIRQVK